VLIVPDVQMEERKKESLEALLEQKRNMGLLSVMRAKSTNLEDVQTLDFILARLDFHMKRITNGKLMTETWCSNCSLIQQIESELSEFPGIGAAVSEYFAVHVEKAMMREGGHQLPSNDEVDQFVVEMDELTRAPEVVTFSTSFVETPHEHRAQMKPPPEFLERVRITLESLKAKFLHLPFLDLAIRTLEAAVKNHEYGIFSMGWYDCWPDEDDTCMHWPNIGSWFFEAGDQQLVSARSLQSVVSMKDTSKQDKILAYESGNALWGIGNKDLPRFCYLLTKLRGSLVSQADQAAQLQQKVTAGLMALVITFGNYIFSQTKDFAKDVLMHVVNRTTAS